MDNIEIKDLVAKTVAEAMDKALDGTILKKFEPVSTIRIIPLNGQILVKVCFSESSMELNRSGMPRPFIGAKFYVAGTSMAHIPIGKEIMINNRTKSNMELLVDYEDNDSSRLSIHKFIKSEFIKKSEEQDYITQNPQSKVVEYMLVSVHDILAIIEPKAKTDK